MVQFEFQMNIHVRYFASLREIVGKSEETLGIDDGATVSAARAVLLTHYPRLQAILDRSLCAVNRAYVPAETVLHDGDELVFIPPMGGGNPGNQRCKVCGRGRATAPTEFAHERRLREGITLWKRLFN